MLNGIAPSPVKGGWRNFCAESGKLIIHSAETFSFGRCDAEWTSTHRRGDIDKKPLGLHAPHAMSPRYE